MHDFLLRVPNVLFYDNMIQSKYKNTDLSCIFLHRDKPMLFINHEFAEENYGNSYFNKKEALMVRELIDFLASCDPKIYDK